MGQVLLAAFMRWLEYDDDSIKSGLHPYGMKWLYQKMYNYKCTIINTQ